MGKSDLARHYDNVYADEGTGDRSLHLSRWPRNRSEASVYFAGQGSSVLDVGCGNGTVLYNLRQRFDQLYGVELSGVRARSARLTLASCHATIVQSDVEAGLPFPDGQFDSIILSDVVEHVVDVYAALTEVTRVLKPGGKLNLSTPNVARVRGRLSLLLGSFPATGAAEQGLRMRTAGDLLDAGHLHYFTYSMCDALLRRFGYREVRHYGIGRLGRLHHLYPALLSPSCQVVAIK